MSKIVLCVFSLITFSCFGQDTSSFQKFLRNFDFDIAGAGYHQSFDPNNLPNILVPDFIKETRNRYNTPFNSTWNKATDNPLYHLAYYFSANGKYKVNENIILYATLFAEHRGFSYGTTNTNSILVFPQIGVDVNKKFNLFNDTLKLFAYYGNLINPKLYEGLTIYNLYQQGEDVGVKWKKFQIRVVHIGDLIEGIGLGIGDAFDYIASLEELKISKSWFADIRGGYSDNRTNPLQLYNPYQDIYNFSIGISKAEKVRLYFQASYRPNNSSVFDDEDNLASVAGLKLKTENKRFKTENVLEGRYYGAGFNAYFKNTNVHYRQSTNRSTVGDQFYPLMLYDRPFSQWAVFAEYQQPGIFKDIACLTYQLNSRYFIYKELMIKTDLDFNYIFAGKENPFLYPFYNAGIRWEEGNNTILLSATNKGMNLDLHYPTFYLYETPSIMFTMKRNLDANWFGGH